MAGDWLGQCVYFHGGDVIHVVSPCVHIINNSPINRSNPLRILGPSTTDIKTFRFLEKPSATFCIMKLTDLMLQKLQIALHLESF